MTEWPDTLISDIARKRVVIVIGSGVSRHSVGNNNVRPPNWKSFLNQALLDCPLQQDIDVVSEALASGDYLHACEWLKKRFDDTWVNYLRRTFSLPAFAPAPIHEEILKMDSRVVFSLNFDDIYERHVSSIYHGSHIVKNYYDADVTEVLRGDGRYIIKVHGNLNSPENLIFTQKEYSRARVRHNLFYQAFDAALLTHTFLFMGSGISDPDINLLLENQNFGFPSQSPHFFLTSAGFSNERKSSLRENRNLRVLEYDPVDEFHSGLVLSLKELNTRLETEILEIAKFTRW